MAGRRELRPRDHKDKDVRKALKEVLAMHGGDHFRLLAGGHWGLIRCRAGCCQIGVKGTPRNAGDHASDLLLEAAKCPREDGDIRNRRRW